MGSDKERRIKLYRGAWCVVWSERIGDKTVTKRHSLRTDDRGTAERNFQEYLRQLKNTGETIAEILDQWAEDRKHLQSITAAKSRFRVLKDFFGNLLPDQITRDLCRAYVKKRAVGNSTSRNELAILRSAVNWKNPHNKAVFELPPPVPPKDHFLSKGEYKKLLNAASGHIKLFIIVAFHTGARSNAVLDLTWDRVDLDRKLINLSKGVQTNKRRALVPINDVLLKHLKDAHFARTCDYVIEYGGKNIVSIRKAFGKTAQKAGVKTSPHVLRHTAAMVMAEGKTPLEEIEQFLGHSGRSTTQRVYAKYSPTYLKTAASTLAKWHLRACGSK